ncbi:MAG: sulfite exporter TauE/SafE family protein [Halieaceae bacterium]|jgi:uncharacterized protein|nr:sulfite exporter TauE/SafE family protein [Halieaceae bacterium]
MTELSLLSAFSLGLAGTGHCLGMCGGIAAALNLGSAPGHTAGFAYHLGRIISYTILGGLLGLAVSVIDLRLWSTILRYIAGLLLIGMGLYIANWWRGMVLLEKVGAIVWQPVQRLTSTWIPVHHWHQALRLGLCWGFMPCGLIYSSLAWAATANDALQSALLMFCFGLGTLPAMFATSLGANALRQFLLRRELKLAIGLLLIASGLWTVYVTYLHGRATGAM